jgi:hypothetical protein
MSVHRAQGIRSVEPLALLLVALLATLVTSGCKTGTASSKPSWWAFGNADPAKLASAPAAGGIEKPSTTAKPYPVTSTPQPYSLTAAAQPAAGAAPAEVAATPPAVTYGSTPAPRMQPVAAATPPDAIRGATAPRQQTPLASVAPQVGPYTGLPGESPAAAGGAAVAVDAAGDRFRSAPPERYADARPSDSLPPSVSPAAGSRFEPPAGGRFGGGQYPSEMPAQSPAASPAGFSPVDQPPPASGFLPAAAAGATLDSPAVPAVPASAPASLTPSPTTPLPTRRPDPMYRPAGTSSYRPGREILVGSGPEADSAVRQASFDTPPSGN